MAARSWENMQVAVRLRPMTNREREKQNKRIVEIEQNTIQLMNPKHTHDRYKKFTFDYSYWSYDGFKRNSDGVCVPDLEHPNGANYVDQERVFRDLGQFLLENAIAGYHSALLAYGQTGSGKSYTVSGYGPNEGILPRFARVIFQELEKCTLKGEKNSASSKSNLNQRYEVYFSMIEIYNEVVRDLLGTGCRQALAESNSNEIDLQQQAPAAPATPIRLIAASSSTNSRGLKIREHPIQGFFVENLSSYVCRNKEEILARIEEGQLNKSIAATRMNETSSRGHTIYEFRIKQYKWRQAQQQTDHNNGLIHSANSLNSSTTSSSNEDEIVITSVVQLVDLAGSERTAIHDEIQPALASATNSNQQHRSSSSSSNFRSSGSGNGQVTSKSSRKSTRTDQEHSSQARFKESVSINQSLSALGNCIQVMSQNSQVRANSVKIPYRDSALTKLLNRCCLSGNSKVVIIATLSPADTHFDETLSTLRFADRAKQIRTHAIINETHRRASLADGGQMKELRNASKLHQIQEATNQTGSMKQQLPATPTRAKPASFGRGKTKVLGATSSNNLPSSRSNPSLAAKTNTDSSSKIPIRAGKLQADATNATNATNAITSDRIRKSRSEQTIAGLAPSRIARDGYGVEEDFIDEEQEEEEEDFIRDLGDMRDGFISPGSDDSMAALADQDLSTGEKIEILNRMLNNSGPSERILAIQEETEPESNSQLASTNKQRATTRTNKLRAEIKQVSLISSTLKKTNPYITNLNADEQLSGVLSYMIKEGETIIGKSGKCDVVIHGTEIRAQHAKIIRSNSNPIYLESLMQEMDQTNAQINIRLNGAAVLKRVQLHHCDRILFGTNSYFVFANLSDKSKPIESDSKTTSVHQIADLDLITYEMAKSEVLRSVMHEDQNKSVIREIKDYTHRPGTGKFKRTNTNSKGAQEEEPSKQQVSFNANAKATQSCNQSKDTVHKLTRSLTMKDSSQNEPEDIQFNGATSKENSHDKQDEPASQDELFRKQLLEDTYDYVIPVTEVNAIATEMAIKVHYELKIVNGEEQLAHQLDRSTFNRNYYDSATSDGFSSSSVADETLNEHNQSFNTCATSTHSNSNQNNNSAASSTGGAGDAMHSPATSSLQNALRTNDNDKQQVTYLSELQHLDIAPELYVRVYLEEFDISFYWHKEKFQARRYKMLELYGPWSLGGKSALVEYLIEQSRIQANYLIDPFIDDPHTNLVLIGHAQISLQAIAHQTDKRQMYDIVNINDELVGSINVEAVPCYTDLGGHLDQSSRPFEPFSSQDLATRLVEDSRQLLGKRLAFMLRIISCSELPAKFSNIFCQYSLGSSAKELIRTRAFYHDQLELEHDGQKFKLLHFDHAHFICFDSVNEDILDFLEYGFLTIQVVGRHLIPKQLIGQSPSMITTIIKSINKYRFKLEQASNFGSANYSNGDYYFESANSANTNSKSGQANNLAAVGFNSAKSINMYEQNGADFDQNGLPTNGLPQENIIDMILTKRKLDRAENQLHYLKRTVNIAEHYNKKHIPIKVVKKLLNSYGQEIDQTSIEEVANNSSGGAASAKSDANAAGSAQETRQKKHCIIQ